MPRTQGLFRQGGVVVDKIRAAAVGSSGVFAGVGNVCCKTLLCGIAPHPVNKIVCVLSSH